VNPIDFDILLNARNTLIESILSAYETRIIDLYNKLSLALPENESISAFEIGTRAYMTSLLDILSYSKNSPKIIAIVEAQYKKSKTMTLHLSSLSMLDRFSG
jgi:hypothetical protein